MRGQGGMHGSGGVHGQGACVAGRGHVVGGHAWSGGVHGRRGMHGQGGCVVRGVCMAGGVHGQGGMCGQGTCVTKGGVHGMHAPPLRDTAGQCAGGTHPTGMHSCYAIFCQQFCQTISWFGTHPPSPWEILDPPLLVIFKLQLHTVCLLYDLSYR